MRCVEDAFSANSIFGLPAIAPEPHVPTTSFYSFSARSPRHFDSAEEGLHNQQSVNMWRTRAKRADDVFSANSIFGLPEITARPRMPPASLYIQLHHIQPIQISRKAATRHTTA